VTSLIVAGGKIDVVFSQNHSLQAQTVWGFTILCTLHKRSSRILKQCHPGTELSLAFVKKGSGHLKNRWTLEFIGFESHQHHPYDRKRHTILIVVLTFGCVTDAKQRMKTEWNETSIPLGPWLARPTNANKAAIM
jgi:hypothetical protein